MKDVKPESEETLKEIARLLQEHADLKLYVVGHTDNQGGFDMNDGPVVSNDRNRRVAADF